MLKYLCKNDIIISRDYDLRGTNMNVNLPKKEKLNIKAVIIYTISIITCIIAIIIAGLSFYFGSDELDRLITIGGSNLTQSDLDYQLLIANFDEIFQNRLEEYTSDIEIQREDESNDIIYTYYAKDETKENSYDLNLNLPYINIDNETIHQYNEEIKQTFEEKAENVLQSQNQNIIYTVQYEATIENDVLSLIIRSNLKEASSAQRVIIQTYNFDLKNQKQITLEEAIRNKQLTVNDVEKKVKEEITLEQQRVEDLHSLGYTIFERNPEDEMYKVQNSKEFFIKDGNIYIIYAYGNKNLTSEMDLVIV